MAEEPGGPGPLPPEVLLRVSRLLGSPAGTRGGGEAPGPRASDPGRGARRRPVRGVGGGVQGEAGDGLRSHPDGGDGALR